MDLFDFLRIIFYWLFCRLLTRDSRRQLRAWFWSDYINFKTVKVTVQLSLTKRASKYLIACSLKAGFKVKQQYKATKWMRVVRVQPPSISWTSGLNFVGSVTIPVIDKMINLLKPLTKLFVEIKLRIVHSFTVKL